MRVSLVPLRRGAATRLRRWCARAGTVPSSRNGRCEASPIERLLHHTVVVTTDGDFQRRTRRVTGPSARCRSRAKHPPLATSSRPSPPLPDAGRCGRPHGIEVLRRSSGSSSGAVTADPEYLRRLADFSGGAIEIENVQGTGCGSTTISPQRDLRRCGRTLGSAGNCCGEVRPTREANSTNWGSQRRKTAINGPH